jgi:anti-sigma factor RsiW
MLADRPHGRRLTAAEQMRLNQLAERLRDDDPELADALRDGRPRPEAPRKGLVASASAATAVLVLLGALFGGAPGALTVVLLLAVAVGVRELTRRGYQRVRRRSG